MAQRKIFEGTWEEITSRHGEELRGKRLRVSVEDDPGPAKYLTAEEWGKALRAWADSHERHQPPLPDEAMERESIYEGRP